MTTEAANTASADRRRISERMLINALGVEQLELYLLMATQRLGQYDSITHLLYFTEEEAARIAAELGKPPHDWGRA